MLEQTIIQWLDAPGHTKRGLALELGISTVALNNKLNGDAPWKWSEVCTISELVGCSLDSLRDPVAPPSSEPEEG